MNIKCVFCGDRINNPGMGQMMCNKKECIRAYQKRYRKEYNKDPKIREKRRECAKKYFQNPKKRKRIIARNKAYIKALFMLRKKYKEEFDKIYEELKGEILES